MKLFERSTSLPIRAREEDLLKFLDSQMKNLPSFISSRPDLQEDIQTEIVKAADGTYVIRWL